MLMHPIKPGHGRQERREIRRSAGQRTFRRYRQGGQSDGGGFVNYLWPNPGNDEPVAKTSYSQHFAPWDWYLVTGMYMDDVQSAFYASLLRWLVITVTLGALATVAMLLVLRSIRRNLGGDLELAVTRRSGLRAATSPRACRVQANDTSACSTRLTPCRADWSRPSRAFDSGRRTSMSAHRKSRPATPTSRSAPSNRRPRWSKRRRAWTR